MGRFNKEKLFKDFLNKALKKHGNKFDYSSVDYINKRIEILVICPEHGQFLVLPYDHTTSKHGGCRKCFVTTVSVSIKHPRKTLDNFLDDAHKQHGNKFDYSLVNFIGMSRKIDIICPKHGKFSQTPIEHLGKYGCKKCSIEARRITFSDFLIRANKRHKGKFSYEKVEFVDAQSKILITCPKHGDFWQIASNHMLGRGCEDCRNDSYTYSNDEFIALSKCVHGENTYGYNKTIYETYKKSVIITCPKHGDFNQIASIHLRGSGCKKCGRERVGKAQLKYKNIDDFIEKAKKVHGNRYDYSNSVYISFTEDITIKCKIHGEFTHTVASHFQGTGCPSCSNSHGENKILLFLEQNKIDFIYDKKLNNIVNPETDKLFNDCINPKTGKKLKFDFYLPKYNLCIEYDGILHYEPWKNTEKCIKVFEANQGKDLFKTSYCDGKGGRPTLLRIPYWEFDNIEKIITEYLLEHKGITL